MDEDELASLAVKDADQLAELKAQVADLTRRLEKLEQQIQEPYTRPRILRPTPASYHTTKDDGDGLTKARTFAEIHGFSRDRMAGWINRREIQTTPVTIGTQGHVQHKLTPAQERAIIAFWENEKIEYQKCPRCPHTLVDP